MQVARFSPSCFHPVSSRSLYFARAAALSHACRPFVPAWISSLGRSHPRRAPSHVMSVAPGISATLAYARHSLSTAAFAASSGLASFVPTVGSTCLASLRRLHSFRVLPLPLPSLLLLFLRPPSACAASRLVPPSTYLS